jgi:ectoine hydroxylase-related dioxygenase (phytanoyl-CoA dioxygenase family)
MFHGAGENRSADVRRMANLLQVSSAMGVPLEAVDRTRMVLSTYATMAARLDDGVDPTLIGHAAAATAQGYAFPTNLDRDQPVDGLTPPGQLDLVVDALQRRVPLTELRAALEAHRARRATH